MTYQEKARELIENFYSEVEDFDLLHNSQEYKARNETAKQCALIAVDEIITVLRSAPVHYTHDSDICKYWYKVKTEISNL